MEKVARLQCTAQEAAAFLDIRLSEFRRLLRDDERVRGAWERGQELGKVSLRRKQMTLARENAQMAIFLGKQMLRQKEISRTEHTGAEGERLFDATRLTQKERDALRDLLARGSEPEGSD